MALGGSQQNNLGGCSSDEQCDSGNVCLGEFRCNVVENTCDLVSPVPDCDDGASCTIDTCSPLREAGVGLNYMCIHTPVCSSGFICNVALDKCVSRGGPLAPFCHEVGAPCTSGELLEGVGRSERNIYLDTIDGCDDGTEGVYLEDESVEKNTVSAVDGQALQARRMAKIEAVVSPWVEDPSFSIAHFYYAETVSTQFTPEWVYLGFVNPSNDVGTGLQTLEMTFTPSKGGIQAVRVNFGLFLPEGPCVIDDQQTNDYVDHDDLIFTVAKGSGEVASPSKPYHAVVVPPAPHVDASRICASLVQWKHCAKASRICQWSGDGCSPRGD